MGATMPAATPGPILILDYDPDWPRSSRPSVSGCRRRSANGPSRSSTWASTAIPGIAAKPIIDISVSLRQLEDALHCISPLSDIGYVCMGEFGIPGRIFFRKLTDTPKPGQAPSGIGRTHQIHMYRATTSSA